MGEGGADIAEAQVEIACGGSLLWCASEGFEVEALEAAGGQCLVLIRDVICRLFGYHGLMHGETAFSFDHMFGFWGERS